MPMQDTAKLSSNFQISIARSIRLARRRQPGQVFAFIPEGDGVLLVPVPELHELAGVARGAKADGYRERTSRV